ncbi:MAG: flagellar hook-basal body complex protein [Planctomycetaceae bacterium]|jgi:flagellar hook protein FlgE|nr:flagellar hook-basal body complex protein [Planctomycetaceae bacterium]
MGLGLESAIHTAHTGMKASEKSLNVSGTNLSNANTIGYKAERADFADFLYYTYRLGTTPGTGYSAGTNPLQIGMGVSFAGTTTDFSQGSFKDGMTNSDIAINGNGFLITHREGSTQQYYTRNGALKVNENFDLVTNTGLYVLGYGINDKYEVQRNELTNLKIPIGEMHLAAETEHVTIEGIVDAVGDSGTQGTVLRTAPMTDLSKGQPEVITAPTVTKAAGAVEPGSYQYYITYIDAAGNESVPAALGEVNINDEAQNVAFSNLPADTAGAWTGRRIYRSSATDPADIRLAGEIANMDAAAVFTDNVPNSQLAGNAAISFAGRGETLVNRDTKLVNVGKFGEGGFANVFEAGTLTLTPQKGGQELRAATLEITADTTVGQYLDFLNEAYGIRNAADGVPADQGAVGKTINGGNQGAAVIDGAFYFLGNSGTENTLHFDSDDMHLTTQTEPSPKIIDLGWGQDPNQKQDAVGTSVATDLLVYDSLGSPVNVRMTLVLESKSNTETVYRWYADSAQNQPEDGSAIATGSGLIRFDQNGRLIGTSNATVQVQRTQVASVSPLDFDFEVNFDSLMALATNSPVVMQTEQDGAAAGTLYDFSIEADGTILGRFTSGEQRALGQIPLATFRNNEGLYKAGDSLYLAGTNSGDAKINIAGQDGVGVFKSNALELSNTDMGTEIIDMILASAMYRANAKVMTTSNEMYDALLRII